MQDRYTGDIGDFGKYGLLRYLAAGTSEYKPLRLGVVWYRTNPEANNDGRHVSFLERPRTAKPFRALDPALFDLMQRLVRSGSRSVRIVREWGLLPPATVFVEDVVASRADRDWSCERAVAATTDADLVFLDPDNGLEVTSVGRRSATAPKYTYYSELMPYVQRPQSLIVYHHLGRRGTADEQIDGRLTELGACTNRQPFALRFRGGTARAYFVIPSSDAGERLRRRTREFLDSGWASKGLFEDRIYA